MQKWSAAMGIWSHNPTITSWHITTAPFDEGAWDLAGKKLSSTVTQKGSLRVPLRQLFNTFAQGARELNMYD